MPQPRWQISHRLRGRVGAVGPRRRSGRAALGRPGEGLWERVWDGLSLCSRFAPANLRGFLRRGPFPVAVRWGVGHQVPAEDR